MPCILLWAILDTPGPWKVGSRAARPEFRSSLSNLSFPICKIGQIRLLPHRLVRD